VYKSDDIIVLALEKIARPKEPAGATTAFESQEIQSQGSEANDL